MKGRKGTMEVVFNERKFANKNGSILTCSQCGRKIWLSSEELTQIYKYGYVPIYCSLLCEKKSCS